jgi:hypothetical protein
MEYEDTRSRGVEARIVSIVPDDQLPHRDMTDARMEGGDSLDVADHGLSRYENCHIYLVLSYG